MSSRPPLVFKFASEDWEFEQIHRLNYKTFVEEIPQHQSSPSHRLVDKFHAENTYLICLNARRVVGMLAVRGSRPFSLDQKLPNLDSYLPAGRKVCEIRLLAIEKKHRGAQVLQGILALLWQHGIEKGYDLAIISGTTRQFKLYHHLGFVPFGPVVGTGDAQFQPMMITLETFEATAREFLRSSPSRSFQPSAVNLMPGPVAVRREVRRAFEQAPESHRSAAFIRDFQATRQILCELTKARQVQLLVGSGTLANDAVAAQLALLKGRGLVLSSGEFGQRLADHARRWALEFEHVQVPWGHAVDLGEVRRKMEQTPGLSWLWCVHCETSSGVMNDISALNSMCLEFGVKLCLDCISSIGTMTVDLSNVYLASCASGKGLRGYPGLSMVFHNGQLPQNQDQIPRYLDLIHNETCQGIPFTFPSNLLHALHAAVKRVNWDQRFADLEELSKWLRRRLESMGLDLVGAGRRLSPAVTTIAFPESVSSVQAGDLMQESGFLLSYNSEYLRRRNWVQVCTMGECTKEKLVAMLNALNRVCRKLPHPAHPMPKP